MLRFISHLFNAAVFVSLAGLAWNMGAVRFGYSETRNNLAQLVRQFGGTEAKAEATGPLAAGSEARTLNGNAKLEQAKASDQATARADIAPSAPGPSAKETVKDATELPAFASGVAQSISSPPLAPLLSANPQSAVTSSALAREPQSAKAQVRTEGNAAKTDRSDEKAGTSTGEATKAVDTVKLQPSVAAGPPSAIPPRTEKKADGDAIVPPIRRQKPSIQVIAGLGQKPLNGKAAAPTAAKAAKSAAKGPSVRTANTAASAPKKRLDLAGRSSLGVSAKPIAAGNGRGGCSEGLRFDARISRCVPLPSPTAATPLRVRGTP